MRLFDRIGLMSRLRRDSDTEVLKSLLDYLIAREHQVVLEKETVDFLGSVSEPIYSIHEIGQHCDLIIVVGGDGSLLQAAKAAVAFDKPILGINKGYLGFLADIHPNELSTCLDAILEGKYHEEKRFLLEASISRPDQDFSLPMTEVNPEMSALNDVVLLPGKMAHLIEFDVYIDQKFVCHHRADGLIVATPTGSTAYALSGGGPILHPSLDAIVLVPMFSHTLSSRPIVVSGDSEVTLSISANNSLIPRLSCDGQGYVELQSDDIVKIQKKSKKLRLIHPTNYDYFETLRTKLHWEFK